MTVSQRALEAMGEGFTAQAGPLLPVLVQALVADAEQVDALVSGQDGWSQAYDLDNTPVPGWLGQLFGVAPAPGTLQQQRDRVRARGFTRGTVDAIRAAAQSTMTFSRTVEILERQGSAYRLTVRTYQKETPDPDALAAAVRAVLPAGLVLTTAVLSGQLWSDVAASGATWESLLASGSTWDDLRLAVPTSLGTQTWGAVQRNQTWESSYPRNWSKLRKPTAPNPVTTTVTTWSHATTKSWAQTQTSETWNTAQREDV